MCSKPAGQPTSLAVDTTGHCGGALWLVLGCDICAGGGLAGGCSGGRQHCRGTHGHALHGHGLVADLHAALRVACGGDGYRGGRGGRLRRAVAGPLGEAHSKAGRGGGLLALGICSAGGGLWLSLWHSMARPRLLGLRP